MHKQHSPTADECDASFETEAVMVSRTCAMLMVDTVWRCAGFVQQFEYPGGRTDIVALTEDEAVIAFEAKLRSWRTALHQAFRSTSFAKHSYVVLPRRIAARAMTHANEFRRLGVGLCSMESDNLTVLIESGVGGNVRPWLTERAVSAIVTGVQNK